MLLPDPQIRQKDTEATVEADICGGVDSIKNPLGGNITADSIGELILEADKVDVSKTLISCKESA